VPLLLLATAVAAGCLSVARCKDYNELTVRNETDVAIDVRTTNAGEEDFYGIVAAHSTSTLKPLFAPLAFGHPGSITISGSGFRETCTWENAKRHDPLVVTTDGAGCGEVIAVQPISPLQ
jgi:hypothetical protein